MQHYQGRKGYHTCKLLGSHMMMTWTEESVSIPGIRFYFRSLTWIVVGFLKTVPWVALPLWQLCFYDYISSLPETCCLCALAEIGGIFLPNLCDFLSWIFHGGNVWHAPVFSCPPTMQICMLFELISAWGRGKVTSWGEEGLTHDLGWKLCVSL